MLTHIDYTNNLAIIADTISNPTVLLQHLENAANDVGIYIKTTKTEFIDINQQGSIQTMSGESRTSVESFTYRETEINSTEKGCENLHS